MTTSGRRKDCQHSAKLGRDRFGCGDFSIGSINIPHTSCVCDSCNKKKWLLHFSKEKCIALCIMTLSPYPYSIERRYLKHEDSHENLGITISQDLKPSRHLQKICKKASQRLGIIRRCFTNRSSTAIRRLYCGLVRSFPGGLYH